MVSLEVLTRVRLMPPRSTASPLAKCGEGAVDVVEVGGEPLAKVLARVQSKLPSLKASPFVKCGEGAVDVTEVDGEPLAEVLAPSGSMASPWPKCWRGWGRSR